MSLKDLMYTCKLCVWYILLLYIAISLLSYSADALLPLVMMHNRLLHIDVVKWAIDAQQSLHLSISASTVMADETCDAYNMRNAISNDVDI